MLQPGHFKAFDMGLRKNSLFVFYGNLCQLNAVLTSL